MRSIALFRNSLFWLIIFTLVAKAQVPTSHLDLDWNAPYRWVHIDNIDMQKIQLFESARKQWLAALRQGNHLLGDGRPVFWCAKGTNAQTYFTLYPFTTWTEMDSRGKMIKQTQTTVGDSAVKTYDSGDEALISPHGSQIWRRLVKSDIVWPGTDSVTDVTAGVGRMEIHQVDWDHWDEYDKLWKEFQEALIAADYPLVCRVYTNVYTGNQGENMLLWLATDATAYHAAPTIESVLANKLGKEKAVEVLTTLAKYFPLQRSYEMERRPDLCNLGR